MTDQPIVDIKQSVIRRTITRLIIAPAMAVALIYWGFALMPDDFEWRADIGALESWNVWVFLGLILMGSGIWGLLKEALFAFKTKGLSGAWHLRITKNDVSWHVPTHAHGPETGFAATLSEIREVEYRTIQKYEEMDQREYWVHFHQGNSVQLKPYSGLSLSWIASKLADAGVRYNETVLND